MANKVKAKTHKSSKRRMRLTGTGKVKYRKVNKGHLMTNKTAKRSRQLRAAGVLSGGQNKTYAGLLTGF